MKASCVLAAATAFFMVSTEAFVPATPGVIRCRHSRRQQTQQVAAEPDVAGGAWDGKSMPAKSAKHDAIPPDARNWEVENERDDVWDDMPNPVEELAWYKNFAPSDEELAAAEAGFDWTDEWFEAAGITPEDSSDASGGKK